MVAYSFKKQFADKVESGEKKQTIRPVGKRRHAKVGDALQLYTGQRSTSCRKLRDAVCVFTASVRIDTDKFTSRSPFVAQYDGVDGIAKADGFESWEAMRDWFDEQHGLPFEGVLIMWE